MAVTALSGQRWQGRSNAGTAPIVGSVSSNTTIKFSDNGSFTPTGSFTVQYVVVGGGGGGSNVNYGSCRGAGGGGAGAYREASFSAVAGTKYTLTVGAGGTGGVSSASTSAPFGFNGTNGTSSAISGSGLTTITSDGGAQGGGHGTNGYQSNATVRTNGNASGGGTSNGETGGTGGTYGNNGGSAAGTSPYFGSGGGGANSAGGDGSSGNAGAGGDGTVPSASYFSSTALSAGGGGFGCSSNGAGGSSGIGGAGSTDTTGDAGDANTGSGGGATSGNYTAGAGGSGVILLSFADSESYSITDDSTGTTDEKTTVTDVPAGSQFEETDTRKFYQSNGSQNSSIVEVNQYANNGSGTTGSANADRISAWAITASSSYTARGVLLKFYSYSATQRVRVAIYDDDSNSPNNLLNSSSEYTPLDTTDWQAFTLPDTPLTNTTKYWIAMWSNENMDLYNDSTSGEKVKNSITYSATGAFTDPSADDGTDAGTYNVGVSSVGGQTWVERGTAI